MAGGIGDGMGRVAVRRRHPHHERAPASRRRCLLRRCGGLGRLCRATRRHGSARRGVGGVRGRRPGAASRVARRFWAHHPPCARPGHRRRGGRRARRARCSPGCSSPPGASGRRRRARRHCLFTTSGPWCSRDSTGSRWRAAAGSVASSGTELPGGRHLRGCDRRGPRRAGCRLTPSAPGGARHERRRRGHGSDRLLLSGRGGTRHGALWDPLAPGGHRPGARGGGAGRSGYRRPDPLAS